MPIAVRHRRSSRHHSCAHLRVALCAAFSLALLFHAVSASSQTPPDSRPREVHALDSAWRFFAGDAPAAEQPGFTDAAWTTVNLPHDWSIAGPIDKANPSGQGGGYFPNGIGWYRKDIALAPGDKARRVYVVFDGVMANSDVWINGFHLGARPNGSVSFYYDLTGHLNFGPGAHNIIAVRCDNSKQPATRWYEGAGIYRPVRLVVTDNVHLHPWSVCVTTPKLGTNNSTVHVRSTVDNDSVRAEKITVDVTLLDPSGNAVAFRHSEAQSIPGAHSADFNADLLVTNPKLWDIDSPHIYRAVVQVKSGGVHLDGETTPFGIREFHFDAATGFWLNGRNFKIKGAALHVDGGAVGIAVPLAVYEHRLRALRALGVNAIRTAHNPPSPEFLDLCDRLGFLVMDEMFDAWTVGKTPYDYHLYFQQWALRDAHDTVLRDRNHPSIILYSAGNEIHDTPHPEVAKKILASLIAVFHADDPTRPVTQALFRPNVSHDYDDGLADMLDVIGQNYREQELLAAHAAKPSRKILGTENVHDRAVWLAMRDNPPYSGQFLWTGVDYLGEAGEAGGWPIFVNGAGLLDRTGTPRARAFERQSWWAADPNVHIARRVAPSAQLKADPGYAAAPERFKQSLFLDWTPQTITPHDEDIEVYTNCDEVDLLLDGTSLGRQRLHADASPLTWKVPYAAGSLRAVAYKEGKQAATDELRTAAAPAKLSLAADKPTLTSSPDDLVFLDASINDAAGIVVPSASDLVHFKIEGPGKIVAVDNGSNTDHDSFQVPQRHAYEGHATVLVRATGPGSIRVTASASGLASAETTVIAASQLNAAALRSF